MTMRDRLMPKIGSQTEGRVRICLNYNAALVIKRVVYGVQEIDGFVTGYIFINNWPVQVYRVVSSLSDFQVDKP